jgi:hypothetical protein
VAPFTFEYAGNNGWTSWPVTNNSPNRLASSNTQTLSAFNTDTLVGTTLPDLRWNANGGFSCIDTTPAASGNPTGTLVKVIDTKVTIPAAYVRPGASLRCTLLLGHYTP